MEMKKVLLVILFVCLLFVLFGCVSVNVDEHGNPTETIKAVVSYGDGTTETVDVDHYNTGYVSVILHLIDGRTIIASLTNTVIVKTPIR